MLNPIRSNEKADIMLMVPRPMSILKSDIKAVDLNILFSYHLSYNIY